MKQAWTAEVLDPGFLRGLDRLALARRRSARSEGHGSPGRSVRASGLDWMDHRPYEPGDDLRYLDWNLLARIGRPYIRRFFAERAERLDLLVDTSRSMTLGHPPKRDVACALGFIIGYLALSAGERVGATVFAEQPLTMLPALRGPTQLARLLDFFQEAPTGGSTNFVSTLGAFTLRTKEIGRVVLISDLLDGTAEAALAGLRRRGFEVTVVRLRSAGDEAPDFSDGPVTIFDVETGTRRRIDLTKADRNLYGEQRRIEAERTRAFCAHTGISLAMLESGTKLADLVFRDLPHWGLVN